MVTVIGYSLVSLCVPIIIRLLLLKDDESRKLENWTVNLFN